MNVVCRWLSVALIAGSLIGCGTASPVKEEADAPTQSAPPRQTASSEPGPQDPDAPEEFTTTKSGLKYRILRKGTGDTPTSADTVLAHYKGWLDNGSEFDSSYKRGEPTEFPLLGVIPGWTEGLQYISEGGMIELEIPSDLGYGATPPTPKIPPNSTLHFIVELVDVR